MPQAFARAAGLFLPGPKIISKNSKVLPAPFVLSSKSMFGKVIQREIPRLVRLEPLRSESGGDGGGEYGCDSGPGPAGSDFQPAPRISRMSEAGAAPAPATRLTGDPAEFEQLVRTHQRMIFSLTYRMTGSMADAEDLAQETFLRAYEQMSSYRGDSKISTWLCRIAINTCLNWRNREARRTGIHTAWSESTFALQAAPRREEMDERVQAALMKLPPKQRAARALRCSVPTVAWRVFAAKAKLKRLLTPSEPKL